VAGAALSVIVGLLGHGVKETVVPGSLLSQSTAHRFSGAEGNPNDLATMLIVAIVFAGVLAADARRRELRLGLAAVAPGLTVALAATGSRGGLVAFAAALVIAPLLFWPQRLRAVAAIGLVAIAAAGWFAASPADWHRVTNFNDGGAGRSTLWAVAWRMAKDNTPEGVGLNNFRAISPEYLRTPGSLRYAIQIDDPHVVHNEYLELLAETGIVGLLLFAALVGTCLGAARRAAHAFEALGHHDLARISRAVLLAGIAVLVAQLFQSSAYDARLWAVFALGPALLAMAARIAPAVAR
jgi:O-antigen ligase